MGKATTETKVDISVDLATLHVIDMKTFKCATIFSNKKWDVCLNKFKHSFMVPHIIRHNYSREFEDSADLPDLPDGDAVAEVCVMDLNVFCCKTKTKKFNVRAYLSDNSDFPEYMDWVTVIDQGDCMREIFADAIEQTHEAG